MLLTAVAAYWFVTRMLRVRQPWGIYAMACVLPVLVHSLVEFPYAYGYFWVASGLCIGLVEADCHHHCRLARPPLGWAGAGGVLDSVRR